MHTGELVIRAGCVLVFGCGSAEVTPPVPATPSDELFVAARQRVHEQLMAAFAAAESTIAPDPAGSGSATHRAVIGNAPDPAAFAAIGAAGLPPPTARLARCGEATAAALRAFAAIDGPALGEGKMGPRGMTTEQAYAEVTRQGEAIAAAYCEWRDASRICHALDAAIEPFDHRFLPCDAGPAAGSG